jgi:hypothetical protein
MLFKPTKIDRNYRSLPALDLLKAPWLDAYVHSSHFNEHGVSVATGIQADVRQPICAQAELRHPLNLAIPDPAAIARASA